MAKLLKNIAPEEIVEAMKKGNEAFLDKDFFKGYPKKKQDLYK